MTALKRLLLGVFIAFTCLPLVQMTLISFVATLPTATQDVGSLTLANYRGIWLDPALRAAFLNSIAYVLINICITIPVAIPAAYAFSRLSFVGDKHLFLAFIAFRITPPVVLTPADISTIFIARDRQFGVRHWPCPLLVQPANLDLDSSGVYRRGATGNGRNRLS